MKNGSILRLSRHSLALMFLTLAGGCAHSQAVRVVDRETGMPLDNVKITVDVEHTNLLVPFEHYRVESLTTDSGGHSTLGGCRTDECYGTYVTFSKSGYYNAGAILNDNSAVVDSKINAANGNQAEESYHTPGEMPAALEVKMQRAPATETDLKLKNWLYN